MYHVLIMLINGKNIKICTICFIKIKLTNLCGMFINKKNSACTTTIPDKRGCHVPYNKKKHLKIIKRVMHHIMSLPT